MCVQLVGLGAQVAGAGLGIFSAYQQATAHNQALKFNQTQLEHNAEIARMQAQEAREAGMEKRAAWHRGVQELIGTQKAAAAASGVLVGAGSVGDVERLTRFRGAIGAERLRKNAVREAWYLKMMALQYSTQAKMLRMQKQDPWMTALTAGLGSFGGLANAFQGASQEWAMMNKPTSSAQSPTWTPSTFSPSVTYPVH